MEDLPDELQFLNRRVDSDIRHDDSGDEKDDHQHAPTQPATAPSANLPPKRGTGNTGIKGVLADYQEAKEECRIKREAEKGETWRQIERMAITVNSRDSQPAHSAEEDSDPDDEFMREYRKKRMLEMAQSKRPTFGALKRISADEYVDEIDQTAKDVFVVIHLYQDYHKECVRLNYILHQLAPKYPGTKFLNIISTEANPNHSDDISLPSVLVYKGGNLEHKFIPITSKLGKEFDSGDVEMLFNRYKIIKTSTSDRKHMVHKERGFIKNDLEEFDEDFDDQFKNDGEYSDDDY